MSDFLPVLQLEVELSQALPDLPAARGGSGDTYRRASVLVRLHGQPLGTVELGLGDSEVTAAEYAGSIWQALVEGINDHLLADGLEPAAGLGAAGLPATGQPGCQRERAQLLEDAPFLSIVISTRDRQQVLGRCLRSVLALDYPRYEVVVVDNAPLSEATAELVKGDFGHFAQIRYVREEAPGLSRARNRGVREAKGEIVAFTDDDVVVDRHWLSGLARGFRRASRVGCVTGLVLPLELETQAQEWFEEFGGFGKGYQSRVYDLGENRPASPLFPYAAGQFGSGNNMAFRMAALREIGDFDAALGTGSPTRGGEDLASFVATIRAGYSLVYESSAIVRHHHRRDYEGLRRQIRDSGVGLTAFLTKCLLDSPGSLPEFAVKVPSGLHYVLASSSDKNSKKHASYPAELETIERLGMLVGPLAYLRARWQDRRRGWAARSRPGRLVTRESGRQSGVS